MSKQEPEYPLGDTDLYKFTMAWWVWQHFPRAQVSYRLFDRSGTISGDMVGRVEARIREFAEGCWLSDTTAEYLKKLDYLPNSFIEGILRGYRFDQEELCVCRGEDQGISLRITGPWWSTILWEVPLLSIISEDFCSQYSPEMDRIGDRLGSFRETDLPSWIDFGTRRRFSAFTHEEIVRQAAEACPSFAGTSNPYLAARLGLQCHGTMAHEAVSFCGAAFGFRSAHREMMDRWIDTYGTRLGIMLADTYTTRRFLQDFDRKYAAAFKGVRLDSGDPFELGEAVVQHYRDLGIDPREKVLVFSDSLTPQEAHRLASHFEGEIGTAFGVGTHLTNYLGPPVPDIVIKMTQADPWGQGNWRPVIKVSDSSSKATGDETEIEACKRVMQIPGANDE